MRVSKKMVIFLTLISATCGYVIHSDGGNNTISFTAEVAQGGMARLPCDVTTTTPEDKVATVIWYREGRVSPIYSFDARDMALASAVHWVDRELLGSRSSFRVGGRSIAQLTIDEARSTDGGIYRCRVDYQKTPTRNQLVNLTVVLPVEKVSILDENGAHIPHYILGPYNEGAALSIACVATGGRPVARVTWWSDSALLDDSFVTRPGRRVENVLRLQPLTRDHLHAVLTCRAENSALAPPITAAVTLDMNLRPLWVKLLGENRPLSADSSYELECEVVGTRPPPKVSWWKGSLPMLDSSESTDPDGNRTVSILKLTPSIEDGGKHLSCRGEQLSIPESGMEDGWKLDIYHIPVVTLELGTSVNSTMIKEGSDVYFECNIRSNPWIYQIKWMHNGKQLFNNAASGTLVSNQSLVVQGVRRTHSGLYTCVASNHEGDGESNPVQLDVKFPPICRPGQPHTLGAAIGEPVVLACELESNPTAANFTWRLNASSAEAEDALPPIIDDTRSVMRFTPRSRLDLERSFLCWGENEIGPQDEPCVFTLTPAGKPDPVVNCTITNHTSSSVRVQCEEGFDGGLRQHFIMQVRLAGDGPEVVQPVASVTVSQPHFHVSGLDSGSTYALTLLAVNEKGTSESARLQVRTLQAAGKLTAYSYLPEMLNTRPGLAGAIGACATVAALAILIAVAVRRRIAARNKANDAGGQALYDNRAQIVNSNDACPDDRNPDVIPQGNNDDNSDEERAFEYLKNAPSRLYCNTLPRVEVLNVSKATEATQTAFAACPIRGRNNEIAYSELMRHAHFSETSNRLQQLSSQPVFAQRGPKLPPYDLHAPISYRTTATGLTATAPRPQDIVCYVDTSMAIIAEDGVSVPAPPHFQDDVENSSTSGADALMVIPPVYEQHILSQQRF